MARFYAEVAEEELSLIRAVSTSEVFGAPEEALGRLGASNVALMCGFK